MWVAVQRVRVAAGLVPCLAAGLFCAGCVFDSSGLGVPPGTDGTLPDAPLGEAPADAPGADLPGAEGPRDRAQAEPAPADGATVDGGADVADATVDVPTDAAADVPSDVNPDQGIDPTLLAWYRFEVAKGSTVADSSGNGRTATLQSGATLAPGLFGNALTLDGFNDYLALPEGLLSDATDFTIAVWVRLNESDTWARIFDFGTGTSQNMFLTARSGDNTLRFAITVNGLTNEERIDAPPLPTGVWRHVAVTLAGSVGILYVDGAEVGRNSAMTLTPQDLGPTDRDFVGESQYGPDPTLDGQLDELRIYDRALGATEIDALAQSP